MIKILENIAGLAPSVGSSLYRTEQPESIDVYTAGTLEMYDMPGMNDHGRGCACAACMRSNMAAFERMRGDQPGQLVNRYGPLVERIDFSGHSGTGPHLNYDIYGADGKFSRKALGPSHKIDLFKP